MSRLVRNAEFPFDPIDWNGKQKRYANTPQLRRWCSAARDRAAARVVAKQLPQGFGGSSICTQAGRFRSELRKALMRLPIKYWSTNFLEQFVLAIEAYVLEIVGIYEEAKRELRRRERHNLL